MPKGNAARIVRFLRAGEIFSAQTSRREGTLRAGARCLGMMSEDRITERPATSGRIFRAARIAPLPRVRRLRFLLWLGVVALAAGTLWLLGPILTPFIVGAVIAYFLNPLVCRLEGHGIPRGGASAVLVILMMTLILAALVGLVPIVTVEAASLIRSIPDQYDAARKAITDVFPTVSRYEAGNALDAVVNRIGERLADSDAAMFGGVVSSFGNLVQVVAFWVVMPVVAFYLLMDWRRLVGTVRDLIPRANLPTARRLARDVDLVLAGYVRGTATVCMILAAYYAACLGLTGLNYGFLIGLVAGLISFIPYVGAFVGGALAIGVAVGQFWGDPILIALVIAILLVGQFLESQVLVPRLVGASVNLHPVWLIFAILALGYLFGFIGALAAVPLAAGLGVLVRALHAVYVRSDLYDRAVPVESHATDDAQPP
jgi:predicted PurR-regulated permease PerM